MLRLIAEGLQGPAIAFALDLAHSTVRSHRCSIYRKLGVTHSSQALVVAFNSGWIDPLGQEADPLRYDDGFKPSAAQRVYLDAFDRALRARDPAALHDAKRRTDAALVALTGGQSRSEPGRDWLDGVIDGIASDQRLRAESGERRRGERRKTQRERRVGDRRRGDRRAYP